MISAGWPHLAGAHPTGKWKSGEPGGEGLGSSKVIGKGSLADLEPWSQEGHSGGLWLPKVRAAPGFHQGGGVCFGCNSQIMGLRLVLSGCGRWELMGFPQAIGSRSLAGIRACHHKLVGRMLSSLPAHPKRKASPLALPCLEASTLV